MSDTRPVALIPAYKPEPVVVDIARTLLDSGRFQEVVVINDGSGSAYDSIFDELSVLEGVRLLGHAVNLGKGAALKAGLNAVACATPESVGVVTLDADGQHLAKDVVSVADKLIASACTLVIGARVFGDGVPMRSKFGNIVTRNVMRLLGGLKLKDTQSGLRGIPLSFVPSLLRLKTSGYDFELDMLLKAKEQGVLIEEVPIETVYLEGNPTSHFNPFLDSLKIYMVFLRFNLSSLLAVAIDYSVFSVVYPMIGHILYSQFVARACCGLVVFFVNRNFVFKSDQNIKKSFLLYYAALFIMGIVSYGIIELILRNVSMSVILAKALAEGGLYIVGFVIQRELIFPRKAEMGVLG